MRCYIYYKLGDTLYSFGCLNNTDFSKLSLDGVFVVYAYKLHDHHYYFEAFIYETQYIYVSPTYRSKSNLVCAIQNFLQ